MISEPQSTVSDDQQQKVTRYFRSSVPEWEAVYTREDVYSAIYKRRREVALATMEKLKLRPRSHILEAGCGPGLTTAALAKQGHRVHAIDILDEMIEVTRSRTAGAGLARDVRFSIGDVRKLAFREGAFDAVLVIGVTEWIASVPELLREIARVIRPGGFLVISADNRWAVDLCLDPMRNPLLAALRRAARRLLQAAGCVREPSARGYAYSAREFDRRLSEAGFRSLARRQVGFGPMAFMGLELPRGIGLRLDRSLQALADEGRGPLQSAGHVFVVAATKL